VAAAATVAKAEAKAAPAEKRVAFFYSSAHRSGEQFPCDPKKALSLLAELKAKGVAC
jgi:hypothetical protein